MLWLFASLGFGLYVSHFGNYNATYGSLGGVVVFLTWLYLSAYILIMGGELNSELELEAEEQQAKPAPSAPSAAEAHPPGSPQPGPVRRGDPPSRHPRRPEGSDSRRRQSRWEASCS